MKTKPETVRRWREKNKEHCRLYRVANHAHILQREKAARQANPGPSRRWVAARIARNTEYINTHKARPCIDCNQEFPPHVMDFDHVRGEKQRLISDLRTASFERIRVEMEKCDLVCSNCHRIRTYTRQQGRLGAEKQHRNRKKVSV